MINFQKLRLSFTAAFKGIKIALKEQQNLRIQVFMGILAILLAFIFELSLIEFILVILIIALIISLEMINSGLEKLIDFLHPAVNFEVGIIKDILAGAVLVSAIAAIIIGFLIFWPHIF